MKRTWARRRAHGTRAGDGRKNGRNAGDPRAQERESRSLSIFCEMLRNAAYPRNQRATITSMPRRSNSALSSAEMPSSVMRQWIRLTGPRDENELRPILVESARR